MMRHITKKVRNEKGQILIAVLCVLVFGALVIPPTLAIIQNGFKMSKSIEENTEKIYSADSGVDQAIAWLQSNLPDDYPDDPERGSDALGNIHPDDAIYFDMTIIDGYQLIAALAYLDEDNNGNPNYEVISVAGPNVDWPGNIQSWENIQTYDIGEFTKLTAYVVDTTGDFAEITQHVITSQSGATIQGGQASLDPEGLYDPDNPESNPHGTYENYDLPWPTAEQMIRFYKRDIQGLSPWGQDSLDLDQYLGGPFYEDHSGSNQNYQITGDGTYQLTGTMYLKGDIGTSFDLGTTGSDFTLDLNGHTIFVENYTSEGQNALRIGGKCTLTGSGCIIALGNMELKPNIASEEGDYILVMSILGTTYMQPNGEFHGTLAGNLDDQNKGTAGVFLQNGSVSWNQIPEDVDLNFPGFVTGVYWGIAAWRLGQ